MIGRDGWLFYAPGVASVGGPGFLDPALMASRVKAALDAGDAPVFPDPRPAILAFARFLAVRGIKLVFFPVPDKASLQPVELHGRTADGGREPGRNPDLEPLEAELRAAGVLVYDPSPDRLRPGEPPFFLRQDTHWTPAWMRAVADGLARFIAAAGIREAPAVGVWSTVPRTVARVGDVTDMLGLPDGQTLFMPETVTIDEVHGPSEQVFVPDERADVLLLGDSFTNVFSLEQMGWGAGAGFGAQLARALGRGVDVMAQNDAGAHATRQLLHNALAGGEDRLHGKTVVVWEVASRELAVGSWAPVDWARGAPAPAATAVTAPAPAPPPSPSAKAREPSP